ncbi:MAG TPA: hypothetical protein VHL57_02930, partial [Flavobacteriales bacterium]|nr:hypothetical protein [Flavobacteriales bacterium]
APSIKMVTLSHLSYNGMTGHAPALDDGGVLSSIIAQKVYNIRVSEDPSYLKQWRGLFFTVPGPNVFGKAVMRGLLDTANGHRILVDLKHSDLMTRKYFYDSLMVSVDGTDTIPPICSHCAVTGLSEVYGSPFNNEYSLLKAPFTTTFYPFGINLYDEEIVRIHRNGGIIGLPLEQRVLGGYVNKRTEWALPLKRNGDLSKKLDTSARRIAYQQRYLRHLRYFARLVSMEERRPNRHRHARMKEHRRDRMREDAFVRERSHGAARKALYQAMIFSEERLHVTDDTVWLGWMKDRMAHIIDSVDADTALADLLRKRKWTRTDRRVLDATAADYISAEPFLQNLFYILDRILDNTASYAGDVRPDAREAWRCVCIGSDLDGLIDPIDICSTAGMYPYFRERLLQFIPIFLRFRLDQFDRGTMLQGRPRSLEDYFPPGFTPTDALDMLFYTSLRDFTVKHF